MDTLVFVWMISLLTLALADEPEIVKKSEDFNVNPGGQIRSSVLKWSYDEKAKPVICSFTYQAQGGTNEKWVILISQDTSAPNMFKCILQRPPGTTLSYLFFQNFKVEISGGSLKQAEVYGNDPNAQIPQSEFNVDFNTHTVSAVEKEFKNKMTRIVARFSIAKLQDEL